MRCSAEARHMCMPRRPVVILAEGNKEEMDKHLKRALRDTQLEWHTRQVGHPSLRRLLDMSHPGLCTNAAQLSRDFVLPCKSC